MTEFTEINIETLVLVTAWNEPTVFQGCFKISDRHSTRKRYIFFRCEYAHKESAFLDEPFSPIDYQWSHLYEESTHSHWDVQDETKEHAYYVLKFALYTTLVEMLHRQKFLSMDEVAMQAMMQQVKPMLQQSEATWSDDFPDIGFAVAMDFTPHESTGEQAAVILLAKRGMIH